jgi:hypothetical protein
LLVALAFYWLDSVLSAFQHAPGMTGQDRVLALLLPGTLDWAIGALVAVALTSAGQKFELAPAEPSFLRIELPRALLVACSISAVAAALDVLVELANLGHGIDRALSGLLGYVGVVVLSSATAWWAYRNQQSLSGKETPSSTDREPVRLS